MDNYEQLYLDNEKLAYKFGYEHKILYNEDMMQTIKIALYKACVTFDKSKNTCFSTYAYKCMLNAYNYSFRSKDLKYQYVDDADYFFNMTSSKSDTYKEIENKEMIDLILDYIKKLPKLEQYIVYQNLVNGVPISKLRAKTKYSKYDIYGIINKHKNNLQNLLKTYLQ